jgi:hypothetical protein
MKTYIWNTEYEVSVANAETVEEAKNLLIEVYTKQFVEACSRRGLNKKDFEEDFLNRMDVFKKQDPDIILEPNTAISYDHANE